MRIQLLGPVVAWVSDRSVNLGVRQQRFVLALLALEVNRLVPVQRLVDLVWPTNPPSSARGMIHTHISGLRAIFRNCRADEHGVALRREPAGYELACDPSIVDAHRFEELVSRARRIDGDETLRVTLLDEALGLWRGPALTGVTDEDLRATLCRHLDEARLVAIEDRVEALLRLGRHQEVIDNLIASSAAHADRQRMTGQLMLALHRAGRTREALRTYERARQKLADELGLDPGAELRRLHRAILRDDPELTVPTPAHQRPDPIRPAQLPADPVTFTGRGAELERLLAVARATVPATSVVICAISGMAGVGKTALAVHFGHQIADRYPDGQLYVNLRGFDPGGSPVEPPSVIRGFLDALQVPLHRIPDDSSAQAALYRSLLANRRTLVVLDNARDAEQVRPLLPGAPGSLVVITSRDQLPGLVATEGAHPLILDVFSEAESREFLARRLGAEQVAAQTAAVAEIVRYCARLPLALAIAATRAAMQPDLPLADLAAELRAARGRLDAFDIGDVRADVRAVFSWSYERVSPPAARQFRLLGLHPGPHVTVTAAASLAASSRSEARSLLNELTRAQLVVAQPAGRYTLHDLLHAYATEQAHRVETDDQRRVATHRMLDHYLHTAHTAARCLQPKWQPLPLSTAQAGVVLDDLTDHRQALSWFAAAHAVLLAVIDRAGKAGFDAHAMQLAHCLSLFLDRMGHWQDHAHTQSAALRAAQRLGDQTGQAEAHRNLGQAYSQLRRFDDADVHLQHSLRLFRMLGEPARQAHTHLDLGWLYDVQAKHREALSQAEQALALFQAAGLETWQANTLNNIGWAHAKLGNLKHALTCCQLALDLLRKLDDRQGQGDAWDSLGYIRHQLGQYRQAAACYRQALDLFRDGGDRYCQAITLDRLGDTYHASGDPAAARTAWLDALTILDELDHPDATAVRVKCGHL